MSTEADNPCRELFIYWHCERGRAEAAVAALAAFQQGLQAEFPGLQARRYLRKDGAEARATLMETYEAGPVGLKPSQQAWIVARGAQALGAWCLAGRHVEVFERLGPPAAESP